MTIPLRVVLAGYGGFGPSLHKAMRKPPAGMEGHAILVGIVDPACIGDDEKWQSLRNEGIALYPDFDAFFAADKADLALLATPIHLHAPQVEMLLARGVHVMCEKPLAATMQDAMRMHTAQQQSGLCCAIGYQWSFTSAIQSLKAAILGGEFGAPIRMKTMVCWPRPQSYYDRAAWAGQLKDTAGRWVLDSPVNNATAHFLHNCFYVLGQTTGTSDLPKTLQAELYRANDITSFDTAAVRCMTQRGVEILYYTTHAAETFIGPTFHYQFEQADIYYDGDSGTKNIIARMHDGSIRNFGDPFDTADGGKIWHTVAAIRKKTRPVCEVEAAMAQLIAANGCHESQPHITELPTDLRYDAPHRQSTQHCIKGLLQLWVQCFNLGILPHEHGGIAWAQAGEVVDLSGYEHFPRNPAIQS